MSTSLIAQPSITAGLPLQRRFAATVPGSNVPIKITSGELVDDKSEMLQPIAIKNLPRAQQRFAKEFEEVNHQRIINIFKKNKKVLFIFSNKLNYC